MKIEFFNYWEGNSMKDGGVFPVYLLEIFAELHPSYKYVSFTYFNFSITIEFGKKEK